jgi:hypothetical protein
MASEGIPDGFYFKDDLDGGRLVRKPKNEADVISGFPYAEPNCQGCGNPLTVENAWMTDGCPCNTPLGINSMNETRWRLLMQLQQEQSRKLENRGDGDGK